ncbi:cation diffusion facilitator family transporter [Sphingomonas sp.]|uniref:cation diffusion facilitator family transporter n=1 Tax=Sphingomonas sp. TaxID=28214 RepID=UPI0017C2C98E|nr:cation diffusion facilitator family transporter [Sphingomonas sp.]MBA3510364.1 cation transporter [Sphingomonas sp.]
MSAGHSHGHSPQYNLGTSDYGRAFAIGITLNLGFVIVEAIYGFIAGSMALIADAGHNLSDVLGLVVAWAGARMARSSPSRRFTYGLKKASILAALINALLLLVAIGAIAAEAVRRLFNPAVTEGATVMAVAAVGILINGATALLFAGGRRHDINIRGAFLHMSADAAVSAAVVVAGFLILTTGQQWIDPVMSLAIAGVIFWSSIGLLKESVWMSLAGVPAGIDVDEVEAELGSLGGVIAVHDLHVWPLSTTETALTAHLVAPEVESDQLLGSARDLLRRRFHIAHSTIQVERRAPGDCTDC